MATVDDNIGWGLAAIAACAVGEHEALGELTLARLDEMEQASQQERLEMFVGMITAGMVYLELLAHATGESVVEVAQRVGAVSMDR